MKHELSERGFKQMEPVADTYGDEVRVYESSAAEGPHIWLRLTNDNGDTAHAHLTLEQAEKIERQLAWLRANHYQRADCEHEFTENLENHQVRCERCGLVVGGCTICVAEIQEARDGA